MAGTFGFAESTAVHADFSPPSLLVTQGGQFFQGSARSVSIILKVGCSPPCCLSVKLTKRKLTKENVYIYKKDYTIQWT